MPPFRQARPAGSSLRVGTMSIFALGQNLAAEGVTLDDEAVRA
jgi:hypothetical protein